MVFPFYPILQNHFSRAVCNYPSSRPIFRFPKSAHVFRKLLLYPTELRGRDWNGSILKSAMGLWQVGFPRVYQSGRLRNMQLFESVHPDQLVYLNERRSHCPGIGGVLLSSHGPSEREWVSGSCDVAEPFVAANPSMIGI